MPSDTRVWRERGRGVGGCPRHRARSVESRAWRALPAAAGVETSLDVWQSLRRRSLLWRAGVIVDEQFGRLQVQRQVGGPILTL